MTRDFKRQADLVDRMAMRVGIDLEEALFRGQVGPDAIADAVIACAGCADPTHCESWLARAEATGATAERALGYCRNGDLFADIKGHAQ